MGGEQDEAAAARPGRLEMLAALDPCQPRDASGRAPPRQRHLEQRDPEAVEMPVEEPRARSGVELGKTQLEIAPGDPHETRRDEA